MIDKLKGNCTIIIIIMHALVQGSGIGTVTIVH